MKFLKFLPRFQAAERNIARLAQRESWRRNEIEQYQLDRLNELWKSAIAQTDYYRELFRTERLPDRFSSLDEFVALVPKLDKRLVRDQPTRFLAANAGKGCWQRTGGSTGAPTRVFWTKRAHFRDLHTRYRWYQLWGIDYLSREVFLWGHAASFAPGLRGTIRRFRQPVIDRLRGRLRLSAYALSDDDLEKYLGQIAAFRPKSIYGYSSAVWMLAKHRSRLNVQIDSIKALMLTGEPASEQMTRDIESSFGRPAIREYGSVECGIMANDDMNRNLRVREDRYLLETIPFENGLYEIVVTGFDNDGFALLRYPIGDLTTEPIDKPRTGFGILATICGRNNDCVVAKSGRLVHSNGVKHVFEQLDRVRRFRVIQHHAGNVTAMLEVGDDLPTQTEIEKSRNRLSQLLEGHHVEIEMVPLIEGNQAGKHRWVISEQFQSTIGQSGGTEGAT